MGMKARQGPWRVWEESASALQIHPRSRKPEQDEEHAVEAIAKE